MLERVRKLITDHPDRQSFFNRVNQLYPPGSNEQQLIARAYDTAKDAFRHEKREGTGERYFEHLRSVALIVMRYLRITDHEIIAAALLHDLLEDIPEWTHERLAFNFTPRVANLVWWVTKPSADRYDGDKEARNRSYHRQLWRAPREAILIKMPDRLHNLITLWDVDEAKQRRKVQETQDFYLPLAEENTLLIQELEDALRGVMSSWSGT